MNREKSQRIVDAVNASGFPFEVFVSSVLTSHGWTIISNRYYIDDIKGVEREIDILAYKCFMDEKENICYYTALIVSCKKSEKSKWCFLTRSLPKRDVNINYFPFHFSTDDERLSFSVKSGVEMIEKRYKKELDVKDIYSFPKSIIAYQQLEETKNQFSQNKDIYDSIITTIKALESEKLNLHRKEKEREKKYGHFYSFYLLSLFDGEMVECVFKSDQVFNIQNITTINYLNRHIVNNEDHFYAIRFITKDSFDGFLKKYDTIADINKELFPNMINSFYKDIFKDDKRVKLFWDKFIEETSWALSYTLNNKLNISKVKIIDYYFYDNVLKLDVYIPNYSNGSNYSKIYEILNEEESYAFKTTQKCLKSIYRYDGSFLFAETLPF